MNYNKCGGCGADIEAGAMACEACWNAAHPQMETCRGCGGQGTWAVECCNGSGGCSCRGREVDMGTCRECGGSGQIEAGSYSRRNLAAIRGLHFIGTGPSSMHDVWPNRGGY